MMDQSLSIIFSMITSYNLGCDHYKLFPFFKSWLRPCTISLIHVDVRKEHARRTLTVLHVLPCRVTIVLSMLLCPPGPEELQQTLSLPFWCTYHTGASLFFLY